MTDVTDQMESMLGSPEYDDALAFSYGPTQPTPSTATKRQHRHVWSSLWRTSVQPDGSVTERDDLAPLEWRCRCGAIKDEARSKRGRQMRNYGNRAELDVARTYGGRKVGHAQGPTDVQGATRKVQVKTTRRTVPVMWRDEFAKLESERDGRLAILLLRFLRPGNLGPDDYLVIRGRDFLEWYGQDT